MTATTTAEATPGPTKPGLELIITNNYPRNALDATRLSGPRGSVKMWLMLISMLISAPVCPITRMSSGSGKVNDFVLKITPDAFELLEFTFRLYPGLVIHCCL